MKNIIYSVITGVSYYPRIFLDFLLYSTTKNDWSLLDKLKDEDCLIVGSGPSLKKTPLDRIKMPSIGMNKINLLFDKTTWRPDLIVCVNGNVLQQNREFFNSTSLPLILSVKALYLGIKRRPNIIFLRISNSIEFQDNILKGIGIGSTVTYTCMQIAAFAKVRSINLVGIDHSFSYSGTKGIELLEGDDPNHFDPNYFKDCLWGLPDLEGSEKAYIRAKNYFDSKGIKVVDYTIDGKLKVFEKRSISSILE